MKVHLHDEQFDGHLHAWCGRGSVVVSAEEFEAMPFAERCSFCDREWFPFGQPEWHFKDAVKQIAQKNNP